MNTLVYNILRARWFISSQARDLDAPFFAILKPVGNFSWYAAVCACSFIDVIFISKQLPGCI